MRPCWAEWGVNATWRCVRDEGHPAEGPDATTDGHQYVYIGRDARRTEGNQVPESVNP